MKKETFVSLILLVPSYARAVDITNTTDCHLSEWREKSAEFKCANGEQYFCSLDENNLFIHGCLKQYRIPANTTGCPFVVRSTKYLPYENKYTRCNVTLVGCPPKNHPGYAISELHKYPLCLVIPEKRDHNITEHPETTSQYSPSTVSTAVTQKTTITSENTTISTGGINGGLVATIIVLVTMMVIVGPGAIFVWRWKKSKKGFVEFVWGLGSGSRYSKSDIKDGEEEVGLNKDGGEEELPQDGKEGIRLSQVRTSRLDSNEGDSSGESDLQYQTEDGQQLEALSSGDNVDSYEAVTKNLFDFVKKGNEGDLKRLLLSEHEKIQQDHRADITVQDIKEAICLWIKLWDRPQPLDNFHILLVDFGITSSLCELLLKPEKYEVSISVLLYAGRLRKKESISFLLDIGPSTTLQMMDKDENTILHHASAMKSLDLVKKVLQLDKSLLDEVNIDSQTAFIIAAKSGCEDIVQFLLQEKAKVMDENDSFVTITEECVKYNWSEIFGDVLSQNSYELLRYKEDHDLCHQFQAGKVVRRLLESYSDDRFSSLDVALQAFPDMFTSKAYYLEQHPLIWVVGTRNEHAINMMLSNANPEDLVSAVDSNHRTILHLCILKRISVDILKNEKLLLLLNTRDSSNNSPIMYAAKLHHKKYFDELLLIEAVTLTDRDKTGKTILHVTVKNNWCKKSEKLLNHRDKNALLRGDERNVTPLMLAVSLLREPRFITLLLDSGSEISDRDHVGKTLFHYFAENSGKKDWEHRRKCIDVLLKFEKFKNSRHVLKVKDFNGQTPVDIAREKEDHECCKLFEENLHNEEVKKKCNGVD